MPRHADRKRWESFRYIADALRAYVDRKPLRVGSPPDWPLVAQLASQQLVSPTIGFVLTRQPEVPDDLKEYFAALIDLNRQRNAILENAICDIIGALNRAGMTPLLMKGAANLLDGLYRDPAARVIGDIDMLVPSDAVQLASQVLAGIGYLAAGSPPSLSKLWSIILDPDLPLQKNEDSGAGVELHHELINLEFVHLINAKDAMTRALPRDRNGLHYLVLHPTDRVLHNIVHAEMHHIRSRKGFVALRQLVDLALLINEWGGAIDWLEIRSRFASAGALAALHKHVALLRELFGRNVPMAVLDTAATVARLQRAIDPPRVMTALREIGVDYWARFCARPLLAINLLNPLRWPPRIRFWRDLYKL